MAITKSGATTIYCCGYASDSPVMITAPNTRTPDGDDLLEGVLMSGLETCADLCLTENGGIPIPSHSLDEALSRVDDFFERMLSSAAKFLTEYAPPETGVLIFRYVKRFYEEQRDFHRKYVKRHFNVDT